MHHVEERTFETFYENQYRQVLALARVLTGDQARAEDVTHDTFMSAFEKWESLKNPDGWVRRVVSNKARSAHRKNAAERRAVQRLESEATVGNVLPLETDQFWSEVRKLPRNQAVAISLFYLEDRPVADIAKVIGCEESTARVHLSRGRRKLAKTLGVEE